jgi:signal transduction histidine kinase
MRLMLRMAAKNDLDGHHRGLANMQARAAEFGGTFEVARARLGGVRVAARIPLGDRPSGGDNDNEVER